MILSNSGEFTATVHSEGYVSISNGDFRKKITLGDYSRVIGTLVDETDQDLTGTTIRYPSSIHSSSKTNTGYVVNLYFPGKPATLRHSNGRSYSIMLPNVMIRVTLNEIKSKRGEFSLGDIKWFATDKPAISLDTAWPSGPNSSDHIWTLPLPNIYSNGSMCTGGNRLPSVIYLDWTILDTLYHDLLLGSPFNNDLSIHNTPSAYRRGSEWLAKLQEVYQDEEHGNFPYELLTNY